MSEIMPYCDLVIGNMEEALVWSKGKDYKTEDKAEIVKRIAMEPKKNQERARTVVITQGHLPSHAGIYDFKTKTYNSVSVEPTKIDRKNIVDTNGAGDGIIRLIFDSFCCWTLSRVRIRKRHWNLS